MAFPVECPPNGGILTGMNANVQYSTWAEVDLGAIANNVSQAHLISGAPVMAVVKANAYGHGAVPVAKAALEAGATWCAVARLEEALELRRHGLVCPVLLLGYTPPARLEQAIRSNFSLTVWSAAQVEAASEAGKVIGRQAKLHLKVDTGMGRVGVPPAQALDLARRAAATPWTEFEGLFTHFARADESDPAFTDLQEERFQRVVSQLQRSGLRPRLVHAANSAAGLTRPGATYDLIRLGIAMYGLHPSAECPLPAEFRPALSWKTVLSHVKVLPPGSGVSYNHEYVTQKDERIGTLPVGYADGLRRARPNMVLVGGQLTPVVGRVCMDQCMLNLDALPDARQGDEVVLIGRQGEGWISAEEVARRWATNNYEVVCGIGARVPRVYFTKLGPSA